MPKPRVIVDPFTGKRRVQRTMDDARKMAYAHAMAADPPLTITLDVTERTARAILHQRQTIKGRRIA